MPDEYHCTLPDDRPWGLCPYDYDPEIVPPQLPRDCDSCPYASQEAQD